MTLWLAIALMTVMAIIILILPLIRNRYDYELPEQKNIEIFKDQLRELDSDLKRGLLGSDEFDAAKVEIQRRILAVGKESKETDKSNKRSISSILTNISWIPFINNIRLIPLSYARWITVSVLFILIPALSISLYLNTGKPGLQAEPLAERNLEKKTQELAGQDIELAIVNLEERLLKNPNNLEGWLMLARTYMTLERYSKAVDILRRASVILGNNQSVMSMLGEAIVLSTNGQITVEAKSIFESVLSNDPNNPAARYYLGLALAQGGNTAQALQLWMDLAADTPKNTPWRQNLVAAIKSAAKDLKTDISEIPYAAINEKSNSDEVALNGPTTEDIAAASEMSNDDRQAMIQSMVESLAEKLKDKPNDPAGWKKLIRAYRVLGQKEKAEQAEIRLSEIQSETNSDLNPSKDDKLKEKGIGPTASEIENARSMSPEDRSAMILDMVERLAERLKNTPDDLEGWLRLARSWKVLQKYKKAVKAYERVVTLAPENAIFQGEYGRAIIDSNSKTGIIPKAAIIAFKEALRFDPDHIEALWFIGYAASQKGNNDEAKSNWKRLLNLLSPGTPDYQAVKQAMESL